MANQIVNSVERTFKVIETLVNYPNGCSLSLISEELDINKSTVHRLLKTLQILGYVSAATVNDNYRLTFKIAKMGQKLVHETNFVQLAMPELTSLRNITKETVNIKQFHGINDIVVFKLGPKSGNFRTKSFIGQSLPLYCTATGKIFLTYRDTAFIKQYWKSQKKHITKLTSTTIVNLSDFLKQSELIKKNGFSTDYAENETDISCVAAPVFDIEGKVNYAISISLQSNKLKESNIKKYAEPLLESTQKLSKELGYEKQ